MSDPFLITGPALIAFSGGRTSAKMLYRILDAHGGALPEHVHVVFANTGKEREQTLRFVHECGSRWGVKINWLEWQDRRKGTPVYLRFAEVGFNSASRKGEPFKALIESKGAVPNAYHRWCTTHLKWQVSCDFMEARGYKTWANVVGLRADEMIRVFKKLAENHAGQQSLAIEFKSTDGRLTPGQSDFSKWCLGCGVPYFIVRSAEAGLTILANHGVLVR